MRGMFLFLSCLKPLYSEFWRVKLFLFLLDKKIGWLAYSQGSCGVLYQWQTDLKDKLEELLVFSFFSAVGILKNCALTNRLVITISRDSKSRQDFRRLSDSLLLNQLITPNGTT